MCDRPDADDLPHTEWECKHCGFRNSMLDAECQNPDCEPDPETWTRDHIRDYRKHDR